MVGILRTNDGVTHIKTISPNGMIETTMIEIPVFPTTEDRNRQIFDFYRKGYTQSDYVLISITSFKNFKWTKRLKQLYKRMMKGKNNDK